MQVKCENALLNHSVIYDSTPSDGGEYQSTGVILPIK